MSKLLQHMDEMSAILTHTTRHEQSLVKALADALQQVDQQLVQDIRSLNMLHHERRAEIYLELQSLAASIGLVPTAHDMLQVRPVNDTQAAVGDWRQAAQTVNYEDELDMHVKTVRGQQ